MNDVDLIIEGLYARLAVAIKHGACKDNIRAALIRELTDLLWMRKRAEKWGESAR